MNFVCSVKGHLCIFILIVMLFSFLVRADNTDEIAKNISVVLESDKTSAYVNQPVSLTLLIKTRNLKVVSIYQMESIFTNTEVKVIIPFKELQPELKYDLYKFEETRRYRCEVVITTPKDVTFSPSLKMDVLYRIEKSPEHKETDEKQATVQVRAQPLVLTVIPLPEVGKPPNFCGAVGIFEFNIKIPSHVITVNEKLHIRFIISGKGFVPEDYIPRVSQLRGFIVEAPVRVATHSLTEVAFEQTLIPQCTGQFLLPSVCFTFFNPEAAKYKTICTDELPINVNAVMDTSNKESLPDVSKASHIAKGFSWLVAAIGITIMGGFILLYYIMFRPINRLPLAIALTVIVLSQGYVLIRAMLVSGVISHPTGIIYRNEHARIAPSHSAIITFEVSSGTEVTVLEMAGEWVKIQCEDKRGWIPISALNSNSQ